MKTMIVLLLLALAGLVWLGRENSTLARSFEKANRVADGQKTQIGMLKNQLNVAVSLADKNERAQVTLRGQLDAAREAAQRQEQTIMRLLNENDEFRRWYHTDLPDAVRRVHQRPACASAGHCLQRLPESQPVPDAGQRPGH
ncbi:Rz-like lysis system protein LysB [Cronobacter sakazakii]|uniref:Rz-like lysis system protein LysB n=1 Tax=Cronobacter sakazakii TaxID=28141 RepID=UPI000977A25D|nr:Rz-like lysis system protein LysB [Cronobacter sakazakii]EJJ0659319.1 LysB family phage lysis regulatory protein [Cronobacter sakazakii]EJJ0669778.1 LysB family phage lysis regulatory protein [Cronobacter sakazakii]EKC5751809.1 LysB family phage lysis regulatory protein [Cronobacter sakazakii]EKK5312925.1 LysB family phage lysis regulatory protein [Cronobacter sakazakii]EKY2077270.1 LysB family phage lysis regulatory protein [Cronobacter sakazakii]